ncbi:unnamed protein product, partial [Staurois parvus]
MRCQSAPGCVPSQQCSLLVPISAAYQFPSVLPIS